MRIALVTLAAAAAAQGQDFRWTDDFTYDGFNHRVQAVVEFDFDGAGLEEPTVVAGGLFTHAGETELGGVARLVDGAWAPLGEGLGASVETLAAWEDGGDWRLVAGNAEGAWEWTGSAWAPLGDFGGLVKRLVVLDPDGAGPAAPALHAMGWQRIARLDGSAWVSLGDASVQGADDLTALDPDGPGPEPWSLFACGGFDFGGEYHRVARLVDGVWMPLVGGPDDQVYALAVVPDDTAAGATLYAAGEFRTIRGQSAAATSVARWTLAGWAPLDEQIEWASVRAMLPFDADGAGPEPAQLLALPWYGGAFGPLAYDPGAGAWQEPDRGVTGVEMALGADGASVLVAGATSDREGARLSGAVRWRPAGVESLGPISSRGLSRDAEQLALFDPDGAGPGPAQLFAGGSFGAAGASGASGLARWVGEAWSAVGDAPDGSVRVVKALQHDDGRRYLYVGGEFDRIGGIAAPRLARWDGQTWEALGDVQMSVWDVELHAVDGGDEALYAAGNHPVSGRAVRRWDGAVWVDVPNAPGRQVYSLQSFDPDGAGPQSAMLFVGGASLTREADVYAWDGISWSPRPGASSVNSMTVADIDGGGESLLVAATQGVYRLVEGELVQLGDRLYNARGLAMWDPDGEGPGGAMLLAAGDFSVGSGPGMKTSSLMRWDGAAWQVFPQPVAGARASSVLALDAAADGVPAGLYVGASVVTDGGPLSQGISRLVLACAADCDDDGELSFFDFLCFQNLFAAGDPQADCDGDEDLTFFDFLCFQNAFAAGCP